MFPRLAGLLVLAGFGLTAAEYSQSHQNVTKSRALNYIQFGKVDREIDRDVMGQGQRARNFTDEKSDKAGLGISVHFRVPMRSTSREMMGMGTIENRGGHEFQENMVE
ncbi:hypothetical protein B0H17DRAFT_1147246 [Mycena rosella]|uniref:Uncharacterized protein n=1 Tax=Mycena rosella TaxID=1033263 RepID=A0AAD7CM31_MYCRO|nr:hypothetical protein B0H17DRAFT_1147246 [Mycena rosella]